jgi:hypothetical protein
MMSAIDAAHLGQALSPVGPVVDGENRQRRINGTVRERQAHGAGSHGRGGAARTLVDHRSRELDGQRRAVARFVGSSSGSDVYHRAGVAERLVDPRGDARVGQSRRRVTRADAIVVPTQHVSR